MGNVNVCLRMLNGIMMVFVLMPTIKIIDKNISLAEKYSKQLVVVKVVQIVSRIGVVAVRMDTTS